jgi:hypothetical protein
VWFRIVLVVSDQVMGAFAVPTMAISFGSTGTGVIVSVAAK